MKFLQNCTEYRVRINLSEKANLIIEEDMLNFDIEKRSTFVNTLIENYITDSKSSVNTFLSHRREELVELYDHLSIKDEMITAILKQEEKTLIKHIIDQKKKKSDSRIYRINKKNVEYFSSDEYLEDPIYEDSNIPGGGLGLHLKCLLEEYAELPYIIREQIFYKEKYDIIRFAIDTHSILKATTKGSQILYIYPYQLMADPLSTRLYLTGMSRLVRDPNAPKRTASLRVPRLKTVTCLKQKGRLTKTDIMQLDEDISTKGVQFLVGDENYIKIKLSAQGLKNYNSTLHLRPSFDPKESDIENNVYVFHCTSTQAMYYFFKFGKDAEILEPKSLRNQFIRQYDEALKTYISNH